MILIFYLLNKTKPVTLLICTLFVLKVFNLFKDTLMQFGIAKLSLLLGRFRKLSAQKLSCEDTYREMAASDEDWSAWDAVVNDVLDNIEMKAKIKKYAGIADEKLSTEQIINLTRE
jgi:hypothetical protein